MAGIERLIAGSNKLTDVFGYRPSFHDAEVIEMRFWRGDVEPDRERLVYPVLTIKFHVWELTNEVDQKGFLVLRHHTLATLSFHDMNELKMEAFNHQNAIFELLIDAETRSEDQRPILNVQLLPAFGVTASFRCSRIEVIDVIPCSDDGIPV